MADGVFGVEVVTPEQSLVAGGATSVVLRPRKATSPCSTATRR